MRMSSAVFQRVSYSCAVAAIALAGVGCKSVQNAVAKQADADPTLRPKIISSARTSCIDESKKSFPQIPNRDAVVNEYCDCFATKGLSSFSNAEIAGIGFTGIKNLTPEQNTTLNTAATMWVAETRQKLGVGA